MAVVSLTWLLRNLGDLKGRYLLEVVENFELGWVLSEFPMVVLTKVTRVLIQLLILSHRLNVVRDWCLSFSRDDRFDLDFFNLAHLIVIFTTLLGHVRDPRPFRFLRLRKPIQEKLLPTEVARLASMALARPHVCHRHKWVSFSWVLWRQC